MTTKHSPGPWKAELRYSNGCSTCPAVIDADGRDLASIHGAPMVSKTGWPNAQLIAAAPDLLEACERLVGVLDGPNDPSDAEINDALATAAKAIAKATGGAL